MSTIIDRRAATRSAWLLGAAAGALVVAAGAAEAQELTADLVGSARACRDTAGDPLLAEGAAICSGTIRITSREVRFGAETARPLPANAIAFNPEGKPGCVNANALPPDPTTYNCTRTLAQDVFYSQCVVELNVAVGEGGRAVNEAACLLRRPITFQVRNPADPVTPVRFQQSVKVVECLVYANATGPDRSPKDDTALGEPVNVCTVGVGARQRLATSKLADAEEGWRVRVTQNTTSPLLPAGSVTSPYTAVLQESLF